MMADPIFHASSFSIFFGLHRSKSLSLRNIIIHLCAADIAAVGFQLCSHQWWPKTKDSAFNQTHALILIASCHNSGECVMCMSALILLRIDLN